LKDSVNGTERGLWAVREKQIKKVKKDKMQDFIKEDLYFNLVLTQYYKVLENIVAKLSLNFQFFEDFFISKTTIIPKLCSSIVKYFELTKSI
jgi:hypothetical protein